MPSTSTLASLLDQLLALAQARALPPTREASKFLAVEMRPEVLAVSRSVAKGRLHIPVYWAPYVHEGRTNSIVPRNGKVLVYFKNPLLDDPRLRGGYPRRRSDVKKLNLDPEEWARLVAEGKMIVRSRVDGPTPPHRFFGDGPGEGMAAFKAEATGLVRDWGLAQVIAALGTRQVVRATVEL
jgi:hypothetical protein